MLKVLVGAGARGRHLGLYSYGERVRTSGAWIPMTAVKPRRRGNGEEAARKPVREATKTAQEATQAATERAAPEAAPISLLEPSPRPPFFSDPGLICIALEAGEIGVWSWDISSSQATWSSNLESVCGLARGRLDATRMILENDVHPD